MQPAVAPEIAAKRKAAVEAALRDGFSPYGMTGPKGGCVAVAATALGENRATIGAWVRRQMELAGRNEPNHCPDWSLWDAASRSAPRPAARSTTRRYLMTAAQDDTPVHAAFWTNLLAYAAHLKAEVMVGGFTYQKGTIYFTPRHPFSPAFPRVRSSSLPSRRPRLCPSGDRPERAS